MAEPAADHPPRRVLVEDGWPSLEAIPGRAFTDEDVRRLRDEQR